MVKEKDEGRLRLRFIRESSRKIAEAKATAHELEARAAMWLSLDKSFMGEKPLTLKAVIDEADWAKMKELRFEIEKEFGVSERDKTDRIVEQIENLCRALKAQYYLAYDGSQLVGEVGIVEFQFEGQKIGRLQDVDIALGYQARGYGRRLMSSVFELTKSQGFSSLCLEADPKTWLPEWYMRLGFEVCNSA